jgi:hypothetical protein
MVGRVVARIVTAAGLVVAVVTLALGLTPLAAQAGPKVTALQIASADLPDGKVVVKPAEADLFARMYSEVSWLGSAAPQTGAPKSSALGPKYTVTVFIQNKPAQVYDLYPLAVGGPRAHRAASQPNGHRTADGWFYGRLTMSESLRLAGAPLKAKPDVVTGGIGGGTGEDVTSGVDPLTTMHHVLGQVRQLFLLNGAVLVVILVGLAGIAYLIRRRV